MESATSLPKRLVKRCPRRNLPGKVGRKRGESNFVLAFSRAYERDILSKTKGKSHRANRELPVTGFGIADFVWVAWMDEKEEGHALSATKRVSQTRYEITAFEMKLTNWQRGFAQACRYRFFSNRTFLVLPFEEVESASKKIDLFRQTGIGLIAYDTSSDRIKRIFSPKPAMPRSTRAYASALSRLGLVQTDC